MMNTRNAGRTLGAAILAAGAIAALSACGRQEDQGPAGQNPSAMNQIQRNADEAKDKIAQGANDVKNAAKNAMGEAKTAVDDAAITASVNSKLAQDPQLSALHINVDTVSGKVVLQGSAPTAAARDHATQIASSVDGVRDVDNQLEVKPQG